MVIIYIQLFRISFPTVRSHSYVSSSWSNVLHACFVLSADFFFKINVFKKNLNNTIRESNSLDPDQARHNVGPDLGP